MHKLNKLFTLSSLLVLLITAERFSFTTKILLQPYNFLRLHEIFQITALTLFYLVVQIFVLYYISDQLNLLGKKFWLLILFIVGVYFFATGNGLHEMASFTLNQYCNVKNLSGIFCHGQFFDDYYTGNIYYFIGGIFMVVALLFTEKRFENATYQKKDVPVTVINAVIYAFGIFAYAAFDPVLVGFVYTIFVTIIADVLFFFVRKKYLHYPFIFYTAISYTVGTIFALVLRFH